MAAPIASLIVRVLADLSELKAGSAEIQTQLGGIATSAQRVGAALGVGLSVGAVVQFARSIVQTADELTRLSDRTGIGVVALQRLQGIAEDSGNTLEQVTKAISQMQVRLVSGDSSAVGALRALGVSLNQLTALDPDAQFLAIARAIDQIPNPARQAQLAVEIFGKAGLEILPSLKADVDRLAASTWTMSEDTVQALDRAGDAWQRVWRNTKGIIGEFMASQLRGPGAFGGVPEGTGTKPTLPPALGFPQPTGLGPSAAPAGVALRQIIEDLNAERDAANKAREANEALAASLARIAGSGMTAATMYEQTRRVLLDLGERVTPVAAEMFERLEKEISDAAKAAEQDLLPPLEKLAPPIEKAAAAMFGFASAMAGFKVIGGPGFGPMMQHLSPFLAIQSISSSGLGPPPPIPGFQVGGPTDEGPAFLHEGEFVVPKGGALVRGGGGTVVHATINYPIMRDPQAMRELLEMIGMEIARQLRSGGARLPTGA